MKAGLATVAVGVVALGLATSASHAGGTKGKPAYELLSSSTLRVRGEIRELSAEGALIAVRTSGGCDRLFLWRVPHAAVRAFNAQCGCEYFDDLGLSNGLAAWTDVFEGCGNFIEASIAASNNGVGLGPDDAVSGGAPKGGGDYVGHLVGRGHVLAWNEWKQRSDAETSHFREQLKKRLHNGDVVVATGPNSYPLVDTDGTRFLVARSDGPLKVLNGNGRVVLSFPFARRSVASAKLSASTLAVLTRGGGLLIYDARTGAALRRYTVPPDTTLADLEGRRVVYITSNEVHVRDVRSNRDAFVQLPAVHAPALRADLSPLGLVVAYQTNDDRTHTLVRIVRAP